MVPASGYYTVMHCREDGLYNMSVRNSLRAAQQLHWLMSNMYYPDKVVIQAECSTHGWVDLLYGGDCPKC